MTGIELYPDEPRAPEVKRWWQSRILWANVIAAVLAAIEAREGVAAAHLGPNVHLWLIAALTGINVILRFDTDKAIQ